MAMFRIMPMRNEALKSEKGVPPNAFQGGYRYRANRAILKKHYLPLGRRHKHMCPVELVSGGPWRESGLVLGSGTGTNPPMR